MGRDGEGIAAALSRLLVAFTIELDNGFEQHMPHRTSFFGPGGPEPVLPSSGRPFRAPLLVSVAMWHNAMRYVPAAGVPRDDLVGLGANLTGLERWGYLRSEAPEAGASPVVKPTPAGRYAQVVWARMEDVVERRWEQRFGMDLLAALRAALLGVTSHEGAPTPLYLPVVSHADGMRTRFREPSAAQLAAAGLTKAEVAGLDTLLARGLLGFTLDFEAESRLSLPLTADVLASLTDRSVALRYVPMLAGVSKEGAQAGVGFLERHGLAITGADPQTARGKAVSLTGEGRAARDQYGRRLRAVEQGWEDRFGPDKVDGLRSVLAAFACHATGGEPTLALGLRPGPNGWRGRGRYRAQTKAVLADPWRALPRHPMLLHRGGYPDGS